MPPSYTHSYDALVVLVSGFLASMFSMFSLCPSPTFAIISIQATAIAEYARKENAQMTDNEKRAHDLALLYIKEQIDRNMVEIHITKQDDIKEFTMNYTDVYLFILDNLNQTLL